MRLTIDPNTNKQILYDLQYIFHRNNSYNRNFKSALDLMPSNPIQLNLRLLLGLTENRDIILLKLMK